MKNTSDVVLSIYSKDDLKNLTTFVRIEILKLLNGLVKFEQPMYRFKFEKQSASPIMSRLEQYLVKDATLVTLTKISKAKVIGTVIIRPLLIGSINVAAIGFLHIDEEYRGQGHGKMLMTTVEGLAKQFNCTASYLTVLAGNESAREFYEEMGYQETQIYMAKNL